MNSNRTFCGCAADAESADDRFEVREPCALAICGEDERVFTACLQDGKSRCAWQIIGSVSWQALAPDC